MKPVNFFWFRRDLRLEDNIGLTNALKEELPVQCVFIFDSNILNKLTDKHDRRLVFIYGQLKIINDELNKYGSQLVVKFGSPEEVWKTLIEEYKIKKVFINHDYEPYARQRDKNIKNLLIQNSIEFCTYKDQVIFEKNEVVKDDGKPYTVFTPYKNKWISLLNQSEIKETDKNKTDKFNQGDKEDIISLSNTGFDYFNLQFPSNKIRRNLISEYSKQRDFPARNGTSKLSVHLRFGTISIRKVAKEALTIKDSTFLNELIWREFYMMILYHFPLVVDHSFKKQYERIKWRNNEKEFAAWSNGTTGYPLVDAGMRELNETGFMHNRVRMVTASFLTKHLLIDWRWGEAYFAKKLLDYELASNNGNWQWAAGCGCDAAPFFRIFNPAEQARKFDPENKYILKWIPELNSTKYPEPIVDHKFARERCLQEYKKVLQECKMFNVQCKM
jgi:deoxyribodipyrimidine photo-lyase